MKKFYVFDCEMHVFQNLDDIKYFPKYQYRVKSRDDFYNFLTGKPAPRYHEEGWGSIPYVVKMLDEAGIDKACLLPESFLDVTDYTKKFSTNGYVIQAMKEHPDRFVGVANIHPILKRGVKAACEELEILVKDYGFVALKIYPPEETDINDERIYPVYQKCQDLGIPVFIHTGIFGFYPGVNRYSRPIYLDDVCNAFPNLPILAYHFGFPWVDELLTTMWVHPNLSVSISCYPGNLVARYPRRFAHELGKAMQMVSVDRIIFGTDFPAADPARTVKAWQTFQIPKDLQEEYEYSPLTDEDKKKILATNLAKLVKVKL